MIPNSEAFTVLGFLGVGFGSFLGFGLLDGFKALCDLMVLRFKGLDHRVSILLGFSGLMP